MLVASAFGSAAVAAGPVEVDLAESHRLRFSVARTVAMEFENWVAKSGDLSEEARAMAAEPAGNGVPNIWKFALEASGPLSVLRSAGTLPEPFRVRGENGFLYGLEFIRNKEPRMSRIIYGLERRMAGEDWEEVAAPVIAMQVEMGDGLESVVLSDGVERNREKPYPEYRLQIELEPVRTFFVHYMSELNPGWSALAYLTTPEPAYFRLFHERPDSMKPVPSGPVDYFRSTGGVNRDLPLMVPGFHFSSGKESARLEIVRAQRAGVDGFAVNCLSKKTEFLESLFDAAADLYRKESGTPFQIGLTMDINVLPHEGDRLLVAVADLIETWLKIGEKGKRGAHLAHRGGRPMVMGYQSNWIWIDYLHRLFDVWEWEQGIRKDDPWQSEFGARPEPFGVPESVVATYARVKEEELARLQSERNPKAEALAGQEARHRAVRAWAGTEDGWRYLGTAYRLVERMVGREIFWQFDATEMDSMAEDLEGVMRVVATEFPAVQMFLPKKSTEVVRRVTHEEGAEWGEPIFSQYVAYGQNEQEGYFLGSFRDTRGTEQLRGHWYQAIGRNLESGEPMSGGTSSLLQYTTWNDYNEHTQIAPSLGLRYSLTELTRRLAEVWKTDGRVEDSEEEEVFLFYRKYPESAVAATFPFAHRGDYRPAVIEVITLLRESATVELWGEKDGERFLRAEPQRVVAGLQVLVFEGEDERLWREGRVTARVRTDSGRELEAAGWEEITWQPFRQDVTLVGASSRCDELWAQDMPNRSMRDFQFAEYGDADGDGLPNWFEMFYFGNGWMNLREQASANPEKDSNGDGISNRQHYLDGTNPVFSGK